MARRALASCALLATLLPGGAAAALVKAQTPRNDVPLVPRELAPLSRHEHALVQLARTATTHDERGLLAAGGVLVSRSLRVWRVPSREAQRLAPRLALAGALEEIQPDRVLTAAGHGAGGDPLLPRQWWFQRVGADRVEPPGPGKPVTVVDSGLDLNHPEFAGRPNTTALNPQSVDGEDEFHGTAVASVIAAPSNGIGIVGIYPQAALYSWDASADGVLRVGDEIEGIEVATATGPGVLNLSIGSTFHDPIEEDAILVAFARGLLVVAAAGNEGGNGSPESFPASLPHVLTVAASGQNDAVAGFSTRSPTTDLAAPGEEIPAAAPLSASPTGFISASGTSLAAPLVAGAAAWVWTQRPTLDRTQLAEVLRRSARDLGTPGRDVETGFGLLDVPAALTAPAPARDPLEPNDDVSHVRPNGLFAAGKPSLTSPARGRTSVNARVDVAEDPEDVYRLWVGAGRRLTVTLRSDRDVDVQLWNADTRSVLESGSARRRHLLAQSARRGTGREQVSVVNRGRRGVFVYLDVFLRADVGFGDAAYTAQVMTVRAPR